MKKGSLPEKVRKWSNTPAANPRYKGATPTDVVRALMGLKPLKEAGEELPVIPNARKTGRTR